MKRNYSDRYINHAPELPEAIARKRRLKRFLTATDFDELRKKPNFTDRIPRSLQDHVSYWSDDLREFVLCEPYDRVLPVKPIAGLVYIELPIEIAPYCGGWSDHADGKPGTRSLLFALAENSSALKDIEIKLMVEGWQAPRWNLVEDES